MICKRRKQDKIYIYISKVSITACTVLMLTIESILV